MKAAYIEKPGPPDAIIYGDLSIPDAGPTQCLVKVDAVAVNPIDTYIRSGMVAVQLPSPFIVGCDLAGTVEAVGKDVRRFRPGDRVWGTNQGMLGRQGTFAQYAAVDEQWLYPTPENISAEQAAAIALVGITARLGLRFHANLQPGEWIFVHGGSGGVGSMVVQMAKAIGANVITTAGTEAKAEICANLGADAVIQYRREDTAEEIRKRVPGGLQVWWETLREPNFDQIVSLLAPRGRIILMAGREARPVFPVGPFYIKDCSMHGFAMFNASPDEQRTAAEDICNWASAGRLRARIDRVLPLSQAAQAHALQEQNTLHKEGTLAGKIVLTP